MAPPVWGLWGALKFSASSPPMLLFCLYGLERAKTEGFHMVLEGTCSPQALSFSETVALHPNDVHALKRAMSVYQCRWSQTILPLGHTSLSSVPLPSRVSRKTS